MAGGLKARYASKTATRGPAFIRAAYWTIVRQKTRGCRIRLCELGWKGTLAVGEQALALFGAAGELRQGDEQLRRCIGGIAFRGATPRTTASRFPRGARRLADLHWRTARWSDPERASICAVPEPMPVSTGLTVCWRRAARLW